MKKKEEKENGKSEHCRSDEEDRGERHQVRETLVYGHFGVSQEFFRPQRVN
jgi:hypothetical protein